MKYGIILLFLFSLVLQRQALGAACCGGGGSIPSLISGDDQAQASVLVSSQSTLAYVDAEGVWRRPFQNEGARNIVLDGALIISDRFQAGLEMPWTQNTSDKNVSKFKIGDLSASFAYEALPQWSYSSWKPKGYLVTQVKAPTGTSLFDSREASTLEITGAGFWSLGVGAVLIKSWGTTNSWDISFGVLQSKYIRRENITPGDSTQLDLEGGRGFLSQLRAAARLTLNFSAPATDTRGTSSSSQRYVTSTFILNYIASDDVTVTASYMDQTLFGVPINQTLNQTLSLAVQKRWPR